MQILTLVNRWLRVSLTTLLYTSLLLTFTLFIPLCVLLLLPLVRLNLLLSWTERTLKQLSLTASTLVRVYSLNLVALYISAPSLFKSNK